MKNLILTFIAIVFTLGFGLPEADAKRLGGGSSFGMQRQITPQQAPRQPSAAPQQSPQQATPPASQPRRSWLGPIAGLAAGLGLAALFSHLGLGEELASFVMLALLVGAGFMLFRLMTRRAGRPAEGMQYAGSGAHPGGADSLHEPARRVAAHSSSGAAAPSSLPADFDAAAFARQAKVHFIRLQAANDSGNLDDIREFTTPEMFAEIRMQLAERGPGTQRTDVVELNADVLDVVEEATRYIVSVRFSGLLREEADAAPAPFDEVWHLVKPVGGGGGWTVAGIQQVS